MCPAVSTKCLHHFTRICIRFATPEFNLLQCQSFGVSGLAWESLQGYVQMRDSSFRCVLQKGNKSNSFSAVLPIILGLCFAAPQQPGKDISKI